MSPQGFVEKFCSIKMQWVWLCLHMIPGSATAALQPVRKTTVINWSWQNGEEDKKASGSLMISLSHKLSLKQFLLDIFLHEITQIFTFNSLWIVYLIIYSPKNSKWYNKCLPYLFHAFFAFIFQCINLVLEIISILRTGSLKELTHHKSQIPLWVCFIFKN